MNKKNQNDKEYITVVMVEPGKRAVPCQLGTTLEDMQKAVHGYIEVFHPVSEPVCYVCNEEGKINGMDPNRAVYDDNGHMIDFICGPFFICGERGDEFVSLTEEEVARLTKKYLLPEAIAQINGKIVAIPYVPTEPGRESK